MTSFGSFLRQLVRDVWSQKLRTFLTVFGIIWGTVAVALLLAVGEGVHQQTDQELRRSRRSHRHRLAVADLAALRGPRQGSPDPGRRDRHRVPQEDGSRVWPGSPASTSRISGRPFGDRTRLVDVSGVSPVFGEMRNMVPGRGWSVHQPHRHGAAPPRGLRRQRTRRGSLR